MWQQLRLPDQTKFQLIDGKTYKVRMCEGVNFETLEDVYGEYECVWRQGLKLWIEKETYEVFEWIDMDDVWIEDVND